MGDKKHNSAKILTENRFIAAAQGDESLSCSKDTSTGIKI